MWSNLVLLWWIALVIISLINIALWIWATRFVLRNLDNNRAKFQIRAMIVLSFVYVAVCAFRSFLPRADVQRVVLFNTWISNVLIGRSAATVAELCFAAQWAILLYYLANQAGAKRIAWVAYSIVPIIFLAEICSWYASISTNYLGNVFEESLWGVTFAMVAISFLIIRDSFQGKVRKLINWSTIGLTGYVLFMFGDNVPLYIGRWQADSAAGKSYLGLISGLISMTQFTVNGSMAVWHSELLWMLLYFSLAVWSSLGLLVVLAWLDKTSYKA